MYSTQAGPTPETIIIIHPESELRGIYARRLKDSFLNVESGASVDDLPELLHVLRPNLLVIHTDALDPRARRTLRMVREIQPQMALISLGGEADPDSLVDLGAAAHVNVQTGRVGDVVEAARRALENSL